MKKYLSILVLCAVAISASGQIQGIWKINQYRLGKAKLSLYKTSDMAYLSFKDGNKLQVYESGILHNKSDSFWSTIYSEVLDYNAQNNQIKITSGSKTEFEGTYQLNKKSNVLKLKDSKGRTITLTRVNSTSHDGATILYTGTKALHVLEFNSSDSVFQEVYLSANDRNRLVNVNRLARVYTRDNNGNRTSLYGIPHHIDTQTGTLYLIPQSITKSGKKTKLLHRFTIAKTSVSPAVPVPLKDIYMVGYKSKRAKAFIATGTTLAYLGISVATLSTMVYLVVLTCSTACGEDPDPETEQLYLKYLAVAGVTTAAGILMAATVSTKYNITAKRTVPNSWQFVTKNYVIRNY